MKDKTLISLSGLYHTKERLMAKIMRRNGMSLLSTAQGRILLALYEEDNVSLRKLSEETSLDKSTLSLSLRRMEHLGLIRRVGDEKDRRMTRIRLTPSGRSYKNPCEKATKEATEILYRGVDPEEREIFLRVLKAVQENVTEQEHIYED